MQKSKRGHINVFLKEVFCICFGNEHSPEVYIFIRCHTKVRAEDLIAVVNNKVLTEMMKLWKGSKYKFVKKTICFLCKYIHIATLTWECLGISREELEKVTEDQEVWINLL